MSSNLYTDCTDFTDFTDKTVNFLSVYYHAIVSSQYFGVTTTDERNKQMVQSRKHPLIFIIRCSHTKNKIISPLFREDTYNLIYRWNADASHTDFADKRK